MYEKLKNQLDLEPPVWFDGLQGTSGCIVSVSNEGSRFADRLDKACAALEGGPSGRHGRLTWLARELEAKFGTTVSVETVRKWFAGISLPRPDKMKQIAQLLNVDVAWLSLGSMPPKQLSPQMTREKPTMNVAPLIAGLMELQGGAVALPRSEASPADFFAIVGRELLPCVVRLGWEDEVEGTVTFEVPLHRGDTAFLLVLPFAEGFGLDVYYVPEALLSRAFGAAGEVGRLVAHRDDSGLTLGGTRLYPATSIHDLVSQRVGISDGMRH